MRALSADLLAIQSHPDALATVTVRCKRRSHLHRRPAAVAAPLQAHGRQHPLRRRECDRGGLQLRGRRARSCRVLRSTAAKKVGVQRFTVTNWAGTGTNWPSAATAALTAAPLQVATLVSTDAKESTPGVGRIGSEIRILYGDGSKLYCVRSTNDGTSWAAPTVAYDGGLELLPLQQHQPVCGSARPGSACLQRLQHQGAARRAGLPRRRQRVGGVVRRSSRRTMGTGRWRASVQGRRRPPTAVYTPIFGAPSMMRPVAGWNSLACQQMQVTSSGIFTAWGSRTVVDRAGVAGAAAYDRVRFGEGGGAYLFALQERAAAGYWFVSSLYALPGNADMEEPVFLGRRRYGRSRLRDAAAPGGRAAGLAGGGRAGVGLGADGCGGGSDDAHLYARSSTSTRQAPRAVACWRCRSSARHRRRQPRLQRQCAREFWQRLPAGNLRRRHALAGPHPGGWGEQRHAKAWPFGWRL